MCPCVVCELCGSMWDVSVVVVCTLSLVTGYTECGDSVVSGVLTHVWGPSCLHVCVAGAFEAAADVVSCDALVEEFVSTAVNFVSAGDCPVVWHKNLSAHVSSIAAAAALSAPSVIL